LIPGLRQKKIQDDSGASYGPKARKRLRAEGILKAIGADLEELSTAKARSRQPALLQAD